MESKGLLVRPQQVFMWLMLLVRIFEFLLFFLLILFYIYMLFMHSFSLVLAYFFPIQQ